MASMESPVRNDVSASQRSVYMFECAECYTKGLAGPIANPARLVN